MPILIRYVKTVEHLRFDLLSCQDIKKLNTGAEITPVTQFYDDSSTINESHHDEGDYLKVLVEGVEEIHSELEFYNHRLEEKVQNYKRFMEQADLKQIEPVRVLHCPQAHGVVVSSKHGNSS